MSFLSFGGEELSWQYIICLCGLLFIGYYLFIKPTPPKPRPPPPKTAAQVKSAPIARKKKVVEVPPDAKAKIKIFFGSQTGTADDFSHTLAKEAKKHHIFAEVVDLETYTPADLKDETDVIFVMATHGEGDPTDNAKEFYHWLADKNKELPEDLLKKLNYTIFGLGNKTYEQYNAVARFVDKRLSDLGAKKVMERGEGDDDCSLEEDFAKWKKRLWPQFCAHLNIEIVENDDDDKFVPRFKLVKCPPSAAGKFSTRGGPKKTKSDGSIIYDLKNPYIASVTENRELHSSKSDRSCRHIELDIGPLIYKPGDHIGVYPENDMELVKNLAGRLNVDLDDVVALVKIEEKAIQTDGTEMTPEETQKVAEKSVLGPCTVRQAFLDAIDITTPPRKAVLKAFSEYATNPEEKKRLVFLSSPAGNDEYNKYIKSDVRTVFEVLHEFPSVQPSLAHILELLPRLAHRYYSISSSLKAYPGKAHITAVVVNYTTPTGRRHQGVCSTWLAGLPVGGSVPVYIRESHFHIPREPAPLIMIGPGTGFAPFRGFLQELDHLIKKGEQEWESVLFFGCRSKHIDFLYEEELTRFSRDKTLSHLELAFSRDQESKLYVQNRMAEEENKKRIWHAIKDKGGYFYVCGDAHQMAKQVQQALHTIAMEQGQMTDEEANKFIDTLQKTGRYLQDVWY